MRVVVGMREEKWERREEGNNYFSLFPDPMPTFGTIEQANGETFRNLKIVIVAISRENEGDLVCAGWR